MSKGRILQIGTPREIYDHPDERFVADFIGDTNFLSGELISAEGRSARVRLDAGAEVDARLPHRMEPSRGQRVTAAIRPEHARLVPPEEGALAGTVETVVYFGTDSHYHLTLSDGSRFTARLQNTAGGMRHAGEGDRVGIAIAPHSVQVLRD
jgi:spermidine/putrescine transport system ATP-binding protein